MTSPNSESGLSERLREMEAKATPGPWKWWTSNSWRRLMRDYHGTTQGVAMPFVASDGHPDLDIGQADMALIVALRNALPQILSSMEELSRLKAGQGEGWTLDKPVSEPEALAATVRSGLKAALILLNIEGDEQPYSSGYDATHDAYNDVWHAARAADALSSALSTPKSGEGGAAEWRTMDSAPRDGRIVLLSDGEGYVIRGFFDGKNFPGHWRTADRGIWSSENHFTHWYPDPYPNPPGVALPLPAHHTGTHEGAPDPNGETI
jgi:hypothetical protein